MDIGRSKGRAKRESSERTRVREKEKERTIPHGSREG